MSKNPKRIFKDIEIMDTGTEGQGIGKAGELVIFVDHAVPGDVVDLEVMKNRKKLHAGKILKTHKLSDKRTEPECGHFGVCGGCKWQHMQYPWQLHFKQKQVYDAFTRIGKIPLTGWDDKKALTGQFALFYPILSSPAAYAYRNRLDFAFSNRRWFTKEEMGSEGITDSDAVGFHVPGMFDRVVDIHDCRLMGDEVNTIRNKLREYIKQEGITFFDHKKKAGTMRGLIYRNSLKGETMLIVMFGDTDNITHKKILSFLHETFPMLTSLQYVINTKANDTIYDLPVQVFKGKDYIMEEMEGLEYRIGPKSFYQTNPRQAANLYNIALEYAGLRGDEIVYDLYTGTGTIANFVASKAKKVIGIESVPEAIADAKQNSLLNGIQNTFFFSGDMKKILSADFIKQNGIPDVVITDPPRAGMDPEVCKRLNETGAEKIVYVSCNPATQARDLLILKEKYIVEKVQPVDMFPQTSHVENVVLLMIRE